MTRPGVSPNTVRFGVFEIDFTNAELRKHGVRLRIQQQPFQILTALLERPGEVIKRDELIEHPLFRVRAGRLPLHLGATPGPGCETSSGTCVSYISCA